MEEFQARFVMKSISVSIGYGSALAALAMTMCIMPCADNGASHENALSIRKGFPFLSMAKSAGVLGKPKGGAARGLLGDEYLAGRGTPGGCLGYGGFARNEPGASIAPQ